MASETREFRGFVRGTEIKGTVTGKYKEISDYNVVVYIGKPQFQLKFEFEMIMVSSPPLYVVNQITEHATQFAQEASFPHARPRAEAPECFEDVINHLHDIYRQRGGISWSPELQQQLRVCA